MNLDIKYVKPFPEGSGGKMGNRLGMASAYQNMKEHNQIGKWVNEAYDKFEAKDIPQHFYEENASMMNSIEDVARISYIFGYFTYKKENHGDVGLYNEKDIEKAKEKEGLT